ncbi:hypothetical protein LguiA_017845 [Lonicera macranthoides]
MSRRNGNGSNNQRAELPATSSTSPQTSCLSVNSDVNSSSTEATSSSMMLVGCPRCLMYVMLAKEDPKCLKCKSTVLLDFLHQDTPATTSAAAKKTEKC